MVKPIVYDPSLVAFDQEFELNKGRYALAPGALPSAQFFKLYVRYWQGS